MKFWGRVLFFILSGFFLTAEAYGEDSTASLVQVFCQEISGNSEMGEFIPEVASSDDAWSEILRRLERRELTESSKELNRSCVERFSPSFEKAEFLLTGLIQLREEMTSHNGKISSLMQTRLIHYEQEWSEFLAALRAQLLKSSPVAVRQGVELAAHK